MNEYQIADGHDSEGDLTALAELEPPLFAAYVEGPATEWHESEGRVWSGDRRLVPVGRGWVVWRFFRLTPDEMAYLRDSFGAQVTIRTLDKGAGAFGNFNATLVLPDPAQGWDADGWSDVRVEFRDLEGV